MWFLLFCSTSFYIMQKILYFWCVMIILIYRLQARIPWNIWCIVFILQKVRFCNIWFIENQSLVQKQYSLSFFCYVIRISRLATPKRRLKIQIYLSLDHLMFSCPFVPHEQMIYFIYVFHLFHLKAFSQSYSTGLWCKLIHNNLLLRLLFCFSTLLLPSQILIALTLFFLDSFANSILKTISKYKVGYYS